MDITNQNLEVFHNKYLQAKDAGAEVFMFGEEVVLTAYAKYLIEYLENEGMIIKDKEGDYNGF